jgi:hypothetical protein
MNVKDKVVVGYARADVPRRSATWRQDLVLHIGHRSFRAFALAPYPQPWHLRTKRGGSNRYGSPPCEAWKLLVAAPLSGAVTASSVALGIIAAPIHRSTRNRVQLAVVAICVWAAEFASARPCVSSFIASLH